jgi:hypothetical protein
VVPTTTSGSAQAPTDPPSGLVPDVTNHDPPCLFYHYAASPPVPKRRRRIRGLSPRCMAGISAVRTQAQGMPFGQAGWDPLGQRVASLTARGGGKHPSRHGPRPGPGLAKRLRKPSLGHHASLPPTDPGSMRPSVTSQVDSGDEMAGRTRLSGPPLRILLGPLALTPFLSETSCAFWSDAMGHTPLYVRSYYPVGR